VFERAKTVHALDSAATMIGGAKSELEYYIYLFQLIFVLLVVDFYVGISSFKVQLWPPKQQLINKTDIKMLILYFIAHIHCMFRSEKSSSGGSHYYIYPSLLNCLYKIYKIVWL
jgi:hypothetical protein